jgi:hypothetical protein
VKLKSKLAKVNPCAVHPESSQDDPRSMHVYAGHVQQLVATENAFAGNILQHRQLQLSPQSQHLYFANSIGTGSPRLYVFLHSQAQRDPIRRAVECRLNIRGRDPERSDNSTTDPRPSKVHA